jgi:hypothetical protein
LDDAEGHARLTAFTQALNLENFIAEETEKWGKVIRAGPSTMPT